MSVMKFIVPILLLIISPGVFAQQNSTLDIHKNSLLLFEAPNEYFMPGALNKSDLKQDGAAFTSRGLPEEFEIVSSNRSMTVLRLNKFLSTKSIQSSGAIPVFIDQNGVRYYLPGGVMVIFQKNVSMELAREILFKHSVSPDKIKVINESAGLYLVDSGGGYDAVNLTNSLKEIPEVVSVEPQKINNITTR